MNLEFRDEIGNHQFEIINNNLCDIIFKNLLTIPEFIKTTKRFNGKDFVVFECVKSCGYIFGGVFSVVSRVGCYIKVKI